MPTSLGAPFVGASTSRMAPVVTAAGFAVAPQFGFVVLTASAGVVLTQWQMIQVALQRKKSGLAYPKMYEDTEQSVFNCYQRAHQNTLESFPAFLALLVLAGLAYPITASAFGLLWVVGRVVYSIGYYTGDPNKRHSGAFHNFGLWGLLITSITFGVKTVLPLLSA